MKFHWRNLKKPFFVLAPMEGATDTVFRQIVDSCGKPDVKFTEFTNVEGLLSKGSEEVGKRFVFNKSEKPLIAHIWGSDPQHFYEVAKKAGKLGFDGIDINMGCPEKNVVAHGCCSALIENPEKAGALISAVKKGANGLPVSVKTRIGFKTIKTEEWISFLLSQKLDALTVHFRTQKEMSKVPAHWDQAEIVSKLRKQIAPDTVIVGNGDVMSFSEGREKAEEHGLDGIMIGRGVFHNPYVFDETVNYETQTKEQRIELLKKHIALFEKTWTKIHPISERGYYKSYQPLKRYFKIYIQGFEGAAEMREKLMKTNSVEEVRKIIDSFVSSTI